MPQIKAVIFDADDVLIIKPKMFSQHLEEDYGIKRSVTSKFFTGDFQNCMIGKADLKEELEKHIKVWGWKGSVEELLKYWFKVEHDVNHELVELIKRLKNKGIKSYLATNNEKYRTEYIRNEMGFSVFLDHIFASGEIGSKKPDSGFFEHMFDKINQDFKISKEDVLFVDDDPENIEAAKTFGFQTLLYRNFPDFEKLINTFL